VDRFVTRDQGHRRAGARAAAACGRVDLPAVKLFASSVGEPIPSYPVVHRIVRKLPLGLPTLAHKASKAYSKSCELVHRREAAKPNAIWQVDHAQLDLLLLGEDGSTARPWLTILIDDYSRAVAGYYLGFDPTRFAPLSP